MGSFVDEPIRTFFDQSHKSGQMGLAKIKIGHLLPDRPKESPLLRPTMTSSQGPAPTTVMAAERAEADRQGLKKRRRASVMGGDYGSLNVQTYKLGT